MSIFARSATLRGLTVLPVAMLIAAAPALAQSPEETVITAHNPTTGTTDRTMRVSIADLNLGEARDQERFAARVASAADTVCADEPGTVWNKFAAIDSSKCRRAAVASAMSRLPVGVAARD